MANSSFDCQRRGLSMQNSQCITWLAILRDMQSYVTCNLTWHVILRDMLSYETISNNSIASRPRGILSLYTLSVSTGPAPKVCVDKFQISAGRHSLCRWNRIPGHAPPANKLAENVRRKVRPHEHLRPAGVCAGRAMAGNLFLLIALTKRILILLYN